MRFLQSTIATITLLSISLPTVVCAMQNSEYENRFRQERLRREGQLTSNDNSLAPKFSSENQQYIDIFQCVAKPSADVEVPAKTSGPLESIGVAEMQAVAAGQTLGKIDSELAEMQVESAKVQHEAAKTRANDDVSVRHAQAAHAVAEKERETNARLARSGALPEQDYERSKLAAEQARLLIEKSNHDLDVAKKEALVEEYKVRAAETSVQRHSIVSPLDGNVVEIFKDAGEWTQEGEKVFRVIQMSRMHVEGKLELGKYTADEVAGKPVTVTLFSGGQKITFEGKIVMIDLESVGGKRITVKAEIENRLQNGRWSLPAGAEVDMRIHRQAPVASAGGSFPAKR